MPRYLRPHLDVATPPTATSRLREPRVPPHQGNSPTQTITEQPWAPNSMRFYAVYASSVCDKKYAKSILCEEETYLLELVYCAMPGFAYALGVRLGGRHRHTSRPGRLDFAADTGRAVA